MEKQTELFKGELMEEKLRLYFLNNGYYVARGIKYVFEGLTCFCMAECQV